MFQVCGEGGKTLEVNEALRIQLMLQEWNERFKVNKDVLCHFGCIR